MPVFVTQGRYTPEALRSLMAHPQDRSKEVEKLFAATGGKLLSYYMTFGEDNFLVISEGPDEGVAVSTLAAASAGGVTHLRTMMAIPGSEMADALSRAAAITNFHGPLQEAQATSPRPQAH